MTTHDYEDMLQVGAVANLLDFTGMIHAVCHTYLRWLLPEPHNTHILKLLFELAHWHGLAKLCMHTDVTLDLLSLATASLGNSLCAFEEKTCAAFET